MALHTDEPKMPTDHPISSPSVPDDDNSDDAPSEKVPSSAREDEYPQGLMLYSLVAANIISVFLIALDQTIVGTAIPKITAEFNGLDDVSWYAAAYFMTFGAALPSAGKIYKYNNLKWTFLWSMLVFEVGSLICGVAPNSTTLIVGRAIAGLGGAGLSVGGTSIASHAVPPEKRPMLMGLIGTTYATSAVLGPILGGVFADRVSWRWCFYINLPIGGVAAVAVFFLFQLPSSAMPPKTTWSKKLLHMDPVGFALAMGSITCFILGLQDAGSSRPWNSSVVIGLLVGFGVLAIALVIWEIWVDEYAMMLPRIYKQRSLWSTAPFGFFFMGSYIVLLYYLPIYFQSILGASPIRSGVYNLPLVVMAAITALAGGAVVMKTGRPQQVMFTGSMLSTVAIGLLITLDSYTSTAKWIGYQIFIGGVMAFAIMHGMTIAQAYVGPEDISIVTANLLFFQTVGGAFSTSAGQAAFVNRLLAALPNTAPGVSPGAVLLTGASELQNVFADDVLPGVLRAYMSGLRAAFGVGTAFSGIAFLVTLLIPFRKLPSHGAKDAPQAVG